MKIVFNEDKYVATTWGVAKHFKAGEVQELGTKFAIVCILWH